MPPGCNSFDADLARTCGVGAALHRRPPQLEESSRAAQAGGLQPEGLLCTRQDMEALCRYGIDQINWRQVADKLTAFADFDQDIDWNAGTHFPWWFGFQILGRAIV